MTVTEFAPAARAGLDLVRAQFESFVGTHCRDFFDALPTMILALNRHRQVVFANQAVVRFLGHADVSELLGLRPGEAFGCVNVTDAPSGCGTSQHCRECGAVRAILSAIEGAVSEGEYRLFRREQNVLEGLDLHVNATPITVAGEQFVVFAITDITHETRRRSMERIFFHDVLNLAGGISGLVEVLREGRPSGLADELDVLHTATQSLVDEILAQRELLAAESNDLTISVAPVDCRELLLHLQALYASTPVAHDQHIAILDSCADCAVETDARLAQRVLGNMLKNALEAGGPGGTVRLGCDSEGGRVRFFVHNAGVMDASVQESIFRRRFSTKGAARGLGTYSMLLLTERYLGGTVGFSSTEADGTTFFLSLPKARLTA